MLKDGQYVVLPLGFGLFSATIVDKSVLATKNLDFFNEIQMAVLPALNKEFGGVELILHSELPYKLYYMTPLPEKYSASKEELVNRSDDLQGLTDSATVNGSISFQERVKLES